MRIDAPQHNTPEAGMFGNVPVRLGCSEIKEG